MAYQINISPSLAELLGNLAKLARQEPCGEEARLTKGFLGKLRELFGIISADEHFSLREELSAALRRFVCNNNCSFPGYVVMCQKNNQLTHHPPLFADFIDELLNRDKLLERQRFFSSYANFGLSGLFLEEIKKGRTPSLQELGLFAWVRLALEERGGPL